MTRKPAPLAASRLAMCRRTFRTGCAMGVALAFAGNAAAQSFLGTHDTPLGGAFVVHSDNTTDIFVSLDQVIIDWQLPSTVVAGNPAEIFQPQGTTATFMVDSGGPNAFTVLNRILPFDTVGGGPVNRAIQFNGTVNSPANSSIWFYSPSGVIAGPTATFNVGSLVLTSNAIDVDGGLYGPGGEIRFRGAASSLAPVEIQPGAVIDAALSSGAYVALVAPRIVQGGSIRADGHVALVAAEQADITINAGLLDIVVTQGNTDPNGIVHTGSSGGPASAASDDVQILSLIAMPKNTALTMLLSGSMGYDAAASAADEGGSVVLSAGHASYLSNAVLAQNLGNIEIGNSQFLSPVTGVATNAIDIAPVAGAVEFEQGAFLTGFRSLSAIAGDGESITGGQALFLNSGQGSSGGSVTIRAEGGALPGDITANGGLFVSARGSEDTLFPESGESIAGTGGSIVLAAAGGTISSDTINLDASGNGLFGMADGGNGLGGTVAASVSGSGSITATDFSASAGGFGGEGDSNGSSGFGGTVSLLDQGGTLDFGAVFLSASGIGGSSATQSGNAQSGSIRIDITSGTKTWSGLIADASALGGENFFGSGAAGSATGRSDAVRLHVGSGAALNITSFATLTADAQAGVNGAGNTGTAGGVSLLVDGGGTLRVENTLNVTADALVSTETLSFNPSASPALTGGTVNILANGGTIEAHDLRASANASGTGALDSGGAMTGGTATVGAANGGTIRTFAAFSAPGFLGVEANAYGGNGPAPANATGGTATLFAEDGALDLDGNVRVSASAGAGPYTDFTLGNGFAAQGGSASLELRAGTAGTASLTAAEISILADGDATGSLSQGMLMGNGGAGTGGTARLSVAAGTLTADSALIRADGRGGTPGAFDTASPFQSGDGFGGTASLATAGGTITLPAIELLARGYGGGGIEAFSGQTPLSGNGTGGNANTQLAGGSINTTSLVMDASGIGGDGSDDLSGAASSPATNGGSGTGGNAQLGMPAGSTALLAAGSVQVTANGIGGTAGATASGALGDGGAGTGGSAGFNLADGGFSLGVTSVEADGIGGSGNTGGNGTGGIAAFLLNDSFAGTAPRTIASLSLLGRGLGGTSEAGPAASETAGQAQLTANAGSAAGTISITGDFLAETTGAIAPGGNGFVANMSGAAFNVGGNSVVATTRDVAMTIGTGGAFATQGMLTISTPRSVTSTGLVSSGSDAAINANLGISMSDLRSGGTTLLSAAGGAVVIGNDLSSAGLVTVFGASVDISSLGALSFTDIDATGGNLAIRTVGDLLTAAVDAAGSVTLASTAGAVRTTGAVSGNGIAVTAGGDVQADADVISTAGLQVQAGGTFRTGARVIGTDILAESGDIAIAPSSTIGQRGTTRTITLRNANPANLTYIGGGTQTGGYSLDAAEAARLFADNSIAFELPGNATASAADFIVGDLALTYGASGNIGSGGLLKIFTPARVEVSGAVALTTSSNADRFSIDPTRIDVVTDTGSIVMRDSGGNLMGQLELIGGTVAVAPRATLAQIAALSDPREINAALDAPPSSPNDAGYLQAGDIFIEAANALYIANTGASAEFADRRGFTANSFGIVTGSAATHISINGVILDAAGLPVTGLDTVPQIVINGAPAGSSARFNPFSSINGCVIGQGCGVVLTGLTKTKSDIEVPLDPDGNRPEYLYVLEIEQEEPDDLQPLVDEPVTGVGNDDFWDGTCAADSGACPKGGNGQ